MLRRNAPGARSLAIEALAQQSSPTASTPSTEVRDAQRPSFLGARCFNHWSRLGSSLSKGATAWTTVSGAGAFQIGPSDTSGAPWGFGRHQFAQLGVLARRGIQSRLECLKRLGIEGEHAPIQARSKRIIARSPHSASNQLGSSGSRRKNSRPRRCADRHGGLDALAHADQRVQSSIVSPAT